ncbi:VIT domain-containing protein [Trichoderma chlorosporum]
MFQSPANSPIFSCGCYTFIRNRIKFLPVVSLDVHTSIVASTSRTILTQTFSTGQSLQNVKYIFPLYDGVSVVGFECTFGSRVIKGVVKEREEAKQEYKAAVASGKVAGLLEQSLEASDVFTTSLGNIPDGVETVKVEITYLGELKHDAQVDGLRFTIPTRVAPRYGIHSINGRDTFEGGKHINITIDADVSSGSTIKSIQSPSHPISVNIGTVSTATSAPPSLQRAHATLFQASTELDKDFIIQIVATGLGDPMAVLETHPTIPNQRALMATLVPRFNLPMEMTEVVFLCDRSGSMQYGSKLPNVVDALKIFLKSLPLGVKFNICSFGSSYTFLWDRSMTYEEETLETAILHINEFTANFGGTEMYNPIEEIFKRRYQDMNLEVFLLTDGAVWQQELLFQLVNTHVAESKGAIRVFTLGVGKDVSHSLIEGIARAGNGFAQTVGENEKMDRMLIRMLKGALTPHIGDYSLEIKYESNDGSAEEIGEDFEVIERVMDAMTLETPSAGQADETRTDESSLAQTQQPISLFDQTVQDADLEMSNTSNSVKAKLPPVAVPRYLQAPFQIPPLFPFNRTSVYVLLSDSTPDRQPKSVILRGTSAHGPLSLEIPVATLTEKGTTIHQLAARKATRELEDGRGWIFHVKKDGKLLQQQFDGQFGDMVKREAVRLGTQYQVSGKWCSFVAVQGARNANPREGEEDEDNDEGDEDEDGDEQANDFEEISFDELSAPVAPAAVRRPRRSAFTTKRKTTAAPTFAPASFATGDSLPDSKAKRQRFPVPSQQSQQAMQQQQQAMQQQSMQQQQAQQRQQLMQQQQAMQQQSMQQRSGRDRYVDRAPSDDSQRLRQRALYSHSSAPMQQQAAAMPQGLFASLSPSGAPGMAPFGNAATTSTASPSSAGLFGSTSSAPSNTGGGLFGSANNTAPQSGGLFGSTAAMPTMPSAMGAPQRSGGSLFGSSSAGSPSAGLFGNANVAAPAATSLFGSAAKSPGSNDVLSALSSLQTFAGNWQWNASLESVLGVSSSTVAEKIQLTGQYTQLQLMNVLATLCAVVFLKKKVASEKDSWELLVQKAEDWLRAQTGADVLELEKDVEDKLFSK